VLSVEGKGLGHVRGSLKALNLAEASLSGCMLAYAPMQRAPQTPNLPESPAQPVVEGEGRWALRCALRCWKRAYSFELRINLVRCVRQLRRGSAHLPPLAVVVNWRRYSRHAQLCLLRALRVPDTGKRTRMKAARTSYQRSRLRFHSKSDRMGVYRQHTASNRRGQSKATPVLGFDVEAQTQAGGV